MKMIKIDSYRKLGLVCALVFVLAVSIFASINVFAQSTRLTVTPDNIVLMDDLDSITKTSSLPWSNITDTAPIGPYSFMISTFTNDTATYYQATNGTDGKILDSWTSSNCSYIIQQAIDACPDANHNWLGGYIVFTAGQFWLNNTVIIDRNIRMEGAGEIVTSLVLGAASNCNMFNITGMTCLNNFAFMEISGNMAQQSVATSAFYAVDKVIKTADLTYDHLWVHDWKGNSFYIPNGWDHSWTNCQFENDAAAAIYFYQNGTQNYPKSRIENCFFSTHNGGIQTGYRSGGTPTSLIIEGNTFEGAIGDGAALIVSGGWNVLFSGNTVQGMTAISSTGFTYCTGMSILNNHFSDCGLAINLASTYETNTNFIQGNHFTLYTYYTGSLTGFIKCGGVANNNVIQNNYFDTSGQTMPYGVTFGSGTGNLVEGNTFVGIFTDILVNGTATNTYKNNFENGVWIP